MKRKKSLLRPDWPKAGRLNLSIHDLPHESASTEWWYVNTHLILPDERSISIFASFFKFIVGFDEADNSPKYIYYLTWAISDNTYKKYYPCSYVDRSTPSIALSMLKKLKISIKHMDKALENIYLKGNVPLPDRMFEGKIEIANNKLVLNFSGNIFVKNGKDYLLKLYDPHSKMGCELRFRPTVPPVRHGDNGIVKGLYGEDMFYYFIPDRYM